MDINIKRFVDIDINYQTESTVTSERDTVVLYSTEGESGNVATISSLSEFTSNSSYSSYSTTLSYVTTFFNNHGCKLEIHFGTGTTASAIVEDIKSLSSKKIVIAYTGSFSVIESVAELLTSEEGTTGDITSIYGINQKIILGRTSSVSSYSAVNNFAVKVSKIVGAEMTMAAYLSRIQIYGTDSVQDYAFTSEVFTNAQKELIENDDSLLGDVLDNNMNVDMELADSIRNLGGNLTNGNDLVNQYMLIVLHQTVTDCLVNLLTQKLRGNSGLSAIYTTIAAELNKYVTNGYLTTDKTYTDATKTIVYNGTVYTLIEENTALTLGYHITVLPYSSLTNDDKLNRKCPPIYIYLADSYGIRNITINGEVI